jgi:rhodanese-related sulfurtransferase
VIHRACRSELAEASFGNALRHCGWRWGFAPFPPLKTLDRLKNKKIMSYTNMGPKQFKSAIEKTEDIVILDVRTPAEVAQGALPDAIVIDFMTEEFATKVKTLDKNKHYYIYCRSGNRSGQACNMMSQMGFKHLVNLDGGMIAWNNQ